MTGRQGHERLRAILAETLDEQLFRALHHYQGVNLEQAALGASASLGAALDATATDQALAGQKEASLVELVREEWLQYFTPTGRPTAERATVSREVESLEQAVAAKQRELEALDGLAERHRELTTRLAKLRQQVERNGTELAQETRNWEALQSQKVAVAQAESAHAAALAAKEEAKRRVEERAGLRDAEASTSRAAQEAEREVEKDRPSLGAARHAVQAASERQDAARTALTEAASAERQARSAEECLRRLISRGLWSERLANARAGQAALVEARRTLATNLMDEERLEAIEKASLAVTEATARLAASAGPVVVEALAEVAVVPDAGSRSLRAGEPFEQAIDGELSFQVGELAKVTVRGSAPEHSLREALGKAERRSVDLLPHHGLPPRRSLGQMLTWRPSEVVDGALPAVRGAVLAKSCYRPRLRPSRAPPGLVPR